jgi:hypothetical protein
MDLENRQTFIKKMTQTYIHTNKINSKRRLCSRVKRKKMLIHSLVFLNRATIMMILFCEEDIHIQTYIKLDRYNSTSHVLGQNKINISTAQ